MKSTVLSHKRKFVLLIVFLLAAGTVIWLNPWSQGSEGNDEGARTYGQTLNWQKELVKKGKAELLEGGGAGLEPLGNLFGRQEDMPTAMRMRIRRNLGDIAALHLKFRNAQHVSTGLGVSFWIVDGRGVTCLFRDGSPASSCRTSVSARREGIWLGTYSTNRARPGQPVEFLALGAAPRAIDSIEVRSGTIRRMMRLRRHTWALRSPDAIYLEKQFGKPH